MTVVARVLSFAGLGRKKEQPNNIGIFTAGGWRPSESLLARLRAGYRSALSGFVSETSAIWADNSFIALRQSVHDGLMGNRDDLADLLANPTTTNLYYGVDNLALNIPLGQVHLESQKESGLNELRRLGVALGILPMWNPEGHDPKPPLLDSDDVLSKLPPAFDFPAPFPGELALSTRRGPASYRAVQAIYQANRLAQIAKLVRGNRCLEIGAGVGRTAYYAHRLGMQDYTIVDLPTALVGQACFLAATLGEDAISLPGEADAAIKLRAPQWIDEASERFDIALNVDSLTEMSEAYARKYVDFIRNNCKSFLSINHEINDFRARDIVEDLFLTRHPYPMRDGYVEEFAVMT